MRRVLILAAAAAALVIAGPLSCGGKKGGSKRPPAPSIFRLTAVSIDGTTDTAARVSGNGVADADGVMDSVWSVTVPMNGTALPSHDGASYSGTLTITAVDVEELSETTVYDIEVDP
ncbi:MAG: hypothetical protein H0X45_11900 [Planctomycetes bacterium]|nr:hypothetical protein [Planctomycetota bacterium]